MKTTKLFRLNIAIAMNCLSVFHINAKTKRTIRLIIIMVFLVIQQFNLHGQSNKYTIAHNGKNLTFEINVTKEYYTLRLDTFNFIDTVYASISIEKIFKNAVSDLMNDTSNLKENTEDISALLYQRYQAKQIENGLNDKIDQLDRENITDVASIKLKNKSVRAHRIVKIKTETNKPKTYSIKNDPYPVKINSIDISFENGVIKDMNLNAQIDTNTCNFSNIDYIPIIRAKDIDQLGRKENNYLAYYYKMDTIYIIDLSDIIEYHRIVSIPSGTYIPKDTTITLNAGKNEIVKLRKSTIAESFDVNIFTDALGYSGKNPNGIVQTEAQLNFLLYQNNRSVSIEKIMKRYKTYRQETSWLNSISPYFKLTKLENNNSGIDKTKISKEKLMLELYKFSNLDFGSNLTFFSWITDSKVFTGNFAGGILRTAIGSDSLEQNRINVTTLYLNPKINLKFFESNKIDFNLILGAYGAWEISPINSIVVTETIKKKNEFIQFIHNHAWLEISQSINLHPKGNKESSIFIRSRQYIGMNNNYYAFQIGYSTTINNIIKF